ncbi:hypothetical protein EDB81DRAFT_918783 [Dactylonectria macrodidyma]|uniref:Dockerin type 1 n=1 Tax=Dactylonectria macrodidyma TaxID=307937 RepID=A0A9P9JNC4_9HYPO|nr:hypothetical protein EDB81DRAFT_918783 [Dactylonectria macrodidyma]
MGRAIVWVVHGLAVSKSYTHSPIMTKSHLVPLFLYALSGAQAAPQAATASSNAEPATFTANANVGPGGSSFKDSDHFRVYNGDSASSASALAMLEGAYDCFVTKLKWRSSGLSYNQDNEDGPWYKTNIYSVSTLEGAAGVMQADGTLGLSYLEVVSDWLATPGVTVHEYGHALHYHQQTWVNQGNTGAWWETLANWVADTYATSDICADAREANGQTTSASEIDLAKVIGDSHQVIVDGTVDSGNYYQAWPFLTYLTSNPDSFAGLGQDTLRQMMLQYSKDSNETPLHTLARVSENATVGEIVGRYWAHMAYVDIGHATAQQLFLNQRESINYANLDSQGSGSYKVKSARQPRYMGANIIPLTTSGAATVAIKVTTSGVYTGTVAVYNSSTGATRYVSLVNDAASVKVASGEEATLVIANTPAEPILYDGFKLSSEVSAGLDYTVTISGATA